MDDEQFNHEAFKIIINSMKDYDIEIHHAYDGEECLTLLRKQMSKSFDFIFMDYNLPIKNGVQTTEGFVKITLIYRNNEII